MRKEGLPRYVEGGTRPSDGTVAASSVEDRRHTLLSGESARREALMGAIHAGRTDDAHDTGSEVPTDLAEAGTRARGVLKVRRRPKADTAASDATEASEAAAGTGTETAPEVPTEAATPTSAATGTEAAHNVCGRASEATRQATEASGTATPISAPTNASQAMVDAHNVSGRAPAPVRGTSAGRVFPQAQALPARGARPMLPAGPRTVVSGAVRTSAAATRAGTLDTRSAARMPRTSGVLTPRSRATMAARRQAQARPAARRAVAAARRVPLTATSRVTAAGTGAAVIAALVAAAVLLLVVVALLLMTLGAAGAADQDRAAGASLVARAAVAECERARAEGDYGHKGERYRAWTGDEDPSWDADFVSWCIHASGLDAQGLWGRFGDVSSYLAKATAEGSGAEVHEGDGYVPEAGDIAIWRRDTGAHIAVVIAPDADGGFRCVEGDVAGGEALSYDRDADGYGGYVAEVTHQAGERGLVVIHPAWSAEAAGLEARDEAEAGTW